MRNVSKCVVSLAAVVGGLTFIGGALAAYTPSFGVASNAASTSITYHQAQSDDPTAQIAVYFPANYSLDMGDVGFPVGKVAAKAFSADLGVTVPLTGSIDPRLSTDTILFAGATTSLATLSTACTGKAVHDAFWTLNLSAAGSTLQVPVYVDRIDPTTALGAVLWFKLTVCLPPPDVPTGTPGRADLGAKLLDVTLTINGAIAEVPGNHRWFMTGTPYTPATGKVNLAGTIEAQALDQTPTKLTLTAKKGAKKGTVTLKGRLSAGSSSVAKQKVTISRGTKVLGTATTNAGGTYALTVRLKSAATVSAKSVVALRAVGGTCTSLLGAPACVGTSAGGYTATSASVRAKP
jgi:hypothetical protein